MYPQILYWKWNDDQLDPKVVERKAYDIIKRSCFTDIYMAPHSMSDPDSTYLSPVMRARVAEANKIFTDNGRRLFIDIDVRHEPAVFYKKSKELAHLVHHIDADLDENGKAFVELPENKCFDHRGVEDPTLHEFDGVNYISEILAAYAVDMVGEGYYKEDTVTDILGKIEISEKDGKYFATVDAGKENAGRHCFFYPSYCIRMPDLMSDTYLECEAELFEAVKDIPVAGACVDEWGLRSLIDRMTNPCFYYSVSTDEKYKENCGRDLKKDLLYFFYAPEGKLGESIKVVNDYIRTIRKQEVKGEQLVYDLTKKYFGKDAFVGCHPTWWGSNISLSFEIFHNGIDWWETPRDYAQTDEKVSIPVRNSLARPLPKPVWYNMWYSQMTMDIQTYFKETWVNARFGGRTHHLGYECYEPGVVLTLWEEGRLEAISEMEEQIAKLNKFQKAKPDARVLYIFGMESFTNWHMANHGLTILPYHLSNVKEPMALSNELFAKNILHDMTPSSEIDRGTITFNGEKAVCGGHTYDAVVLVHPDGCNKKTVEFFDEYLKANKNLIVVGKCEYLDDGSKIDHKFDTEYYFEELPTADQVIEILDNLGVAHNMTEQYCVFEDSSVIATTPGELNVGNPLACDFKIGEHEISFEGTDFVAVRIEGDKPEFCYGTADKLTIDGKSVL